MTLRVGSMFSGYGGLDLAAAQLLDAQPVWVADNDRAAAQVLAHRWPTAPNLGDLTAVDWAQVAPVDVLTAGWPCQPFSQAGQRRGADDDRALWGCVADAVRALRPALVLLENVAAVIPAGELARAAADLAAMGYVGAWGCVRASDVGAPHRRERVFVAAADTRGERHGGRQDASVVGRVHRAAQGEGLQRKRARKVAGDRSATTARHPHPVGQQGWQAAGQQAEARPAAGPAAHPGSAGRQGTIGAGRGAGQRQGPHPGRPAAARHHPGPWDWGPYQQAITRWEQLTRPAPWPIIQSRKGNPLLSGRFTEWLMGLPDGWVTDVPRISNRHALQLCGNGVVPQQAVAAYRQLLTTIDTTQGDITHDSGTAAAASR